MMFRVIKIVNEYLVVVNYGLEHEAREGDTLDIIKIGEEVLDPGTKEILGTLDLIKGQIRVKHAYEKMSLCISNERIVLTNPSIQGFGNTLANFSKVFSTTETKALKVNTEQITGGYDEDIDLVIEIGDLVKVRDAELFDPEE